MRNLKHVYLCVLNGCFCDVMDMGISLHYDVCPEKKSSDQTLGLKTRSVTHRVV